MQELGLTVPYRPEVVNARLVVVANACQTVDETLDQYRRTSTDPAALEANNSYYLDQYVAMIPHVGGQRREIVDAINSVRAEAGHPSFLNEHNSCSLNGVYLYDLLSRFGYAGRTDLVDNIDLDSERARRLVECADIVLLSSTFITSAATIVRVTRVIKEWNSDVKVIVGGAKLTQFADESEIHEAARHADALVLSPNGEQTLLKLIPRIFRGEPIDDVPNVAYHSDGFRRSIGLHHDGVDIDAYSVRWNELPAEVLRSSVNVRTGRGCPFKCKFCTFPSYNDQRVDLMSVETVLSQLRQIMRQPQVKSVRFVDDTLFLNHRHLLDVCHGMIDIGFDLPWTAYLRTTTLNKECTTALRNAGCKLVLVGVESADQQVLNNMFKGTREAHAWEAAKNLHDSDIFGFAFILTGFPGETPRTIDKTIDFLNNSGIHSYVHSPLFVFPNSPIAKEAVGFGLEGGFNDWRHATMDCRGAMDQCMRIFHEVVNAAYIDRGSSITKVLLDHGFTVQEVRSLGIAHNELARRELDDVANDDVLEAFRRLSLGGGGGADHVTAISSPYSRTGTGLQVNSGARF